MTDIVLLGASGSIGTQTLDLLEKHSERYRLIGFSVGRQIQKIPVILGRFSFVRSICVAQKEDLNALIALYPGIKFFYGDEGLLNLLEDLRPAMVVNALVGFVGLFPSLKALDLEASLCLANKETLVIGGPFVKERLKAGHGRLYPIDSEHVAIAKCLKAVSKEEVSRPFLTGSGGAFRALPREALADVTPEMALKHPTWKMGKRITIDCATMMNKGFELMEAEALFDVPIEGIDVVLHDESYVHSGLFLKNGEVIAEVCPPDMHGPIEYALTEGGLSDHLMRVPSLGSLPNLHFHPFDEKRYPAVRLAKRAAKMPLGAGAALNAADEEAVSLFLDREIPFLSIERLVERVLDEYHFDVREERDLYKVDLWARERTRSLAKEI